MKYSNDLIGITRELTGCGDEYAVILLDTSALSLILDGIRCWLDGKYMICLCDNSALQVKGGDYTAQNLRFRPCFVNVNLSPAVIDSPAYPSMRAEHSYPDFRLFCARDDDYIGIIPLSGSEYDTAMLYFNRTERHINAHDEDYMWLCRARSDLFSIFNIAERAFSGTKCGEGSEIIRYIKDNIHVKLNLSMLCSRFSTNRTTLSAMIKELTGLPPMEYVLREKLDLSRLDLLFTEIPVNDLAEKFGFSSGNYYIRAFKKRYSRSPLEYRTEGRAARPTKEHKI
ncbi:MAG: AraC family transcriptional regulator [Eubacteriales bacterium]|nr:AraC family transcriptional regulator [Eubacteriales bacterium]